MHFTCTASVPADVCKIAIGLDTVVTGGSDAHVRIWSNWCTPMMVFQGHAGAVTALAIGPSDGLIYSGSEDMTIRVWDAGDGGAASANAAASAFPTVGAGFTLGGACRVCEDDEVIFMVEAEAVDARRAAPLRGGFR